MRFLNKLRGKIANKFRSSALLDQSKLQLQLEELETRILLASFTVTSTADSGVGSLREAITAANSLAGSDVINFNIGGGVPHVIAVNSALPIITDPVHLDAESQPTFAGSPVVVLRGHMAGANVHGLRIRTGGSTVSGLTINSFDGNGIMLIDGDDNQVINTYIGTNHLGDTDFGNTRNGIVITNSSDNFIGAGSVISGNDRHGIDIRSTSSGNRISGNMIGASADGNSDLGNASKGLLIAGADNIIGGFSAGQSNVISGNLLGIHITGTAATGNKISGNMIGTNQTGDTSLPNDSNGLLITNSPNNTINGTNVISGNTLTGITIRGNSSTNNIVRSNLIGTDATGTNPLGNGSSGIELLNTTSNRIGSNQSVRGNVISGNTSDGVTIRGSSTGNVVRGNFIGTDKAGTIDLGNGRHGVRIINASDNAIGGLGGVSNVIGFNDRDGVTIIGNSAVGNLVLSNSIFNNSDLGIDLGNDGVTSNDVDDLDVGPNELLNFADLKVITLLPGGDLQITYNPCISAATVNYPIRVQFFMADSDGQEGQTLIGEDVYTALDGVSGDKTITLTPPVALAPGDVIVATSTDGERNTSEFTPGKVVNSAPVLTLDADDSEMNAPNFVTTFTEDAGAMTLTDLSGITDLNDTDIEWATVTLTNELDSGLEILSINGGPGALPLGITLDGGSNALMLLLTGGASLADYATALDLVQYENTSDNPTEAADRVVNFVVNDGDIDSNIATATVTVVAANDAPVLADIEAAAIAYTENDAATQITNAITVADGDDANIESALMQITGNYQNGQDVLADNGGVPAGITVGAFNATNGSLALSGPATLANYQTALRAITYQNTSENPDTSTRTVSFTINDGDVNSNTETRDIGVSAANDAPVLADIEAAAIAYTENDAATQITNAITVADVDDANIESALIQITGNYQNGQDVLADNGGVPAGITVGAFNATNGSLALSGPATLANYQTALRAITYQNTSEDPDESTRTISFTVNDGDLNSNTESRDIEVTAVNDNPVAFEFTGANAFDTFTNVGLEAGGATFTGELAVLTDSATLEDGATDVDSLSANFTVDVETKATSLGGSVTINADGSFLYTPEAGDTGTDTFTYTLNDGDGGSDLGNVEIKLDSDAIIWFVDDSAATGGDGTSITPFDSLADVTGATGPDATGQTIFLASGIYTSGVTLLGSQTLFGQGNALTLDLGAGNVSTTILSASTNPVITATTGNGINLASDNTIRGLDIGSTNGTGIAGSNFGTLTISDSEISGGGAGIDIDNGTLAVTFENITSTSGAVGIDLDTVTGSFTVTGSTTIDGTTGKGIDIRNSAGATFSFGATDLGQTTAVGTTGIDIATSNAGATFTFDSLNITNANGTGLLANNSGTVNIDLTSANGQPTVNSTGGPALDITNTVGNHDGVVAWVFGSVTSANSATAGVNFNNIGQSITLGNIDITNPTGNGMTFDTVTAPLTITLGSIDGDNNAGHGISLNGVTGTTVVQGLSGNEFTIVDIGTAGTHHGISATNNPGLVRIQHMTIDDTSGNGITVADASLDVIQNLVIGGTTAPTGDGIRVTNTESETVSINGATIDAGLAGISVNGSGGGTTTVTSLLSNTVSNAGAGGMLFETVTFDNGGADTAGGNTNIGSLVTTTNVTGDGLRLNNVLGGISFGTLNIGNDTGTGLFIRDDGGKGGTFAFSNTGGTINTTNGAAMDIDPVAMNSTFASVSSTNGVNGINLDTISGTVDIQGGSITNPSSIAFRENSSTANVTYDGTITQNNADNAVNISSKTGGTTTFGGLVTANTGAANGIDLTSNTGGTINFTGGLEIDTTTGTGFNATGGGTVSITGTNTIGATTASNRTAVNITDTTIGGSGVTFQSISVDAGSTGSDTSGIILDDTGGGTFTVTGVGTTDGTGGTIENITDVDAITLNNTNGLITLKNMIIEDIADSSDGTDSIGTRSGVDGIHGMDVDGGLTLDNVTMRRFSDNAILGSGSADGTMSTGWIGLQILNSTIEDSNRYHLDQGSPGPSDDKADDNNEGMVRIVGLSGTVVVENSTLQRGAQLLDFATATSGTDLDMTVQNNNFIDTLKEFDQSAATVNVGKAGIFVEVRGTLEALVKIGDPAQANAALGNTFTDNGTASVRLLQLAGATGDVKTVISKNTFQVFDHLTGPDGSSPGVLAFNHPQGGVLLNTGGGTYEGIVSDNMFDQVMHAGGFEGQLSIVSDGGAAEFIVQGNEFKLPWDAGVLIRADGASSTQVLFGGTNAGDQNIYTDGTVGGAGDPGGADNDVGFSTPSPFNPFLVNVRNGGNLDLTIQQEILHQHDDVSSAFDNSFHASINSSGGNLNLYLDDSKSPDGYRLENGGGTFLLFRENAGDTTALDIIDGNGNTGGSNNDNTDPPTVSTSGTITPTDTAPTLPSITIP